MAERFPRGNECGCVKCGDIFSSPSAFDRHQQWRGTGDGARLVGCDPAAAGLTLTMRAGGAVWGWPGTEGWTPGEREPEGQPEASPEYVPLVFVDPFA